MSRPLWFGRLLDWRWNRHDEMHGAYHGKRTHWITKLNRQNANAHETHPGWHLWDLDPDGWYGIGPGLGRTVGHAKTMAEAWIICPDEMRPGGTLHPALSGGGLYLADRGTLHVDRDRGEFTAVLRGEDRPRWTLRPVWDGTGSTIRVARWVLDDREGWPLTSGTWTEASEALTREVQAAVTIPAR